MTNSFDHAGSDRFAFEVQPHGVWEIRPHGKILPAETQAISQHVHAHLRRHGMPAGLLVDATHPPYLSVVRLSALVDTLSQINVPMAVLVRSRRQLELANLLHNTLSNRQTVAYFADRDDAWVYLMTRSGQGSLPPGLG
jgi:hypothetical protein